jgi:membrane protease YdiL (CAAX protease family)
MSRWAKIRDCLYPLISFLLIMVMATMIVSMICAAVTGEYDVNSPRLKAMPLLVNLLYYSFNLFYQRKYFRRDEERFFHDKKSARPAVLICASIFAACAGELLVYVIYALRIPEIFSRYSGLAAASFEGQKLVLLVVVSVVLAPLSEELIFRGMMYRRIRNYLGVPAGVLLSAVAFGIYHANMVQFIYAAVLGILFALLYEKTRTLIVPILCHAAANAAEILRDQLGLSASAPSPALIAAVAAAAVLTFVVLWRCLGKPQEQ